MSVCGSQQLCACLCEYVSVCEHGLEQGVPVGDLACACECVCVFVCVHMCVCMYVCVVCVCVCVCTGFSLPFPSQPFC